MPNWKALGIVVCAASMSGQANHARSPKDNVPKNQQPAPVTTYSYNANCCTTETAKKSDEKPYRWYAPFEDPNWWLVVVAAGTGFVVGWQAWETRKSAENTRKQLSFQMEAMRPRLSISTFHNETFKEALAGNWVFVNMGISNTGGMPAYGVVIDTWIEFSIGEPPDSISPKAKYARADPINIHTGDPSGFSIPLHRKLTEEEKHQMINAKGAIIFRVRMNYRAFADDVHTDQAYLVRPDAMENISKYTSAT
jgi:hypothetical protein